MILCLSKIGYFMPGKKSGKSGSLVQGNSAFFIFKATPRATVQATIQHTPFCFAIEWRPRELNKQQLLI
jgi:hypothetical protein